MNKKSFKSSGIVRFGFLILGLAAGIIFLAHFADAQTDTQKEPIKNFGLRDLNGKMVFLNDFCGEKPSRIGWKPRKMMIVTFFATWCKPCKVETGLLLDLYEKWKDKGLQIMMIGYGKDQTEEVLSDYVKERGIAFPVMADRTGVAGEKFGITGIPRVFVLDHSCRIMEDVHGANEKFTEMMEAHAQELLGAGAETAPAPAPAPPAATPPPGTAPAGKSSLETGPEIIILNATGKSELAQELTGLLQNNGYDKIKTSAAKPGQYPESLVYYSEENKKIAEKISFLLGGVKLRQVKSGQPVTILIGNDWGK
ncbi:MAG: thioredoxin-like domain-containing protein [bacterium]|nr:thioredoxin-like domain-containing protein [bacterium]